MGEKGSQGPKGKIGYPVSVFSVVLDIYTCIYFVVWFA